VSPRLKGIIAAVLDALATSTHTLSFYKMAPSEKTSAMTSTDHSPVAKKIKTTASDHAKGATPKVSSAQTMELEHVYSAHNYHPLPVVFARALGAKVWDPEGNEYLDFLSACMSLIVSLMRLRCKSRTLSSKDCAGFGGSS
jgi:hypothetical protein